MNLTASRHDVKIENLSVGIRVTVVTNAGRTARRIVSYEELRQTVSDDIMMLTIKDLCRQLAIASGE